MSMDFIILLAVAISLPCIIFPEQIQNAIKSTYKRAFDWVIEEERPSAADLLLTFFLLICFGLALTGMFVLLNMILPFVFPVTPPHLPAAMVFLSASVGLAMHLSEDRMKYAAIGLALALPLCFAGLGYLQMAEEMHARGESGVQPFVAGLLIGLISACEIVTVATLLSRKHALGFLWLVFLSPLLIVLLVAWLFGLVRDVPQRCMQWRAAFQKVCSEIRLELEPIRIAVLESRVHYEKVKTRAIATITELVTERYMAIKENLTVRRSMRKMTRWTGTCLSFVSMRRGVQNARKIYKECEEKVQEFVHISITRMRASYKSYYNELPNHDKEPLEVGDDNGDPGHRSYQKLTMLLVVLGSLAWGVAEAEPRFVSVYIDGTGSFPYFEEAKQHTRDHLIKNLGPNDTVVLSRLGNFAERQGLQLVFPQLDSGIEQRKRTSIFEWKDDVQLVRETWEKADSLKTVAAAWLDQLPPQDGGATFYHEFLSFASVYLSQIEGDRHLIIYSDLYQEVAGSDKTRLPPRTVFDFSEVEILFLFVPYGGYGEFTKLREAWGDYFKKAGAAGFRMFDVASSTMVQDLLPPSSLPRSLPPFRPGQE